MTRAASQAGDAESCRTPSLNSSIQTSMNDHGIRYYLCHNKSASVIPYFILAVKSCQERFDLNETQRRYFKYELQLGIEIFASRITKFTRGSSVASYLHEKQTSRIQSLYLYFNYFIKIVPFWLRNIRTKHPVIILRASLFVVTPSQVASWKIECQNFSYVYRSRKHWECKYFKIFTLPVLSATINIRKILTFNFP